MTFYIPMQVPIWYRQHLLGTSVKLLQITHHGGFTIQGVLQRWDKEKDLVGSSWCFQLSTHDHQDPKK